MSAKKKSSQHPRIAYPLETEAAWFVLREFFDPLDCSEKVGDGAPYMNENHVLCHVYSKTGIYRPRRMTKGKFHAHLLGKSTFFYRSRRYARHQTGFGPTEKHVRKVLFIQFLNVQGKRVQYRKYYVMLLGIDIDAHHGETDALDVQNWLVKDYCRDSYWEKSSGGKGRHGYLKLAYRDDLDLDYVKSVLTQVFELLDQKRQGLGFQAPIDVPCGMPSKVTRHPEIQLSPSQIEELRNRILYSSNTFFGSHSDSNHSGAQHEPEEEIRLPYSIKRSQGIKFPRFNQTHGTCHQDDIERFHNMGYYDFSFFEELLKRLKQELNEDRKLGIEEKPSTAGISVEGEAETPVETSKMESVGENENLTLEGNGVRDRRLGGWGSFIIVRSPHRESSIYEQRIAECKGIKDKLEKTWKFYWAYSLYLGNVPPVKETIQEYLRQGLNGNPALDSPKRNQRFESVRKYIVNIFDPDKCGVQYGDWEKEKETVIYLLQPRIAGMDMTWAKGKKKAYPLAIEDLALMYYAIRKSNQVDDRRKTAGRHQACSYDQVRKVFQQMKKGCHRAKVAKMLKILLQIGMIQKTGKYIKGERGNCYAAVEPLSRAG